MVGKLKQSWDRIVVTLIINYKGRRRLQSEVVFLYISDISMSLSLHVRSMSFTWMGEALMNTSQLILQLQNLVLRLFVTTRLVPAILI